MQALVSVFDKKGIVEFAKCLHGNGFEIISTGGTAKKLSEEGIQNIQVSDITKFPELLDGRVKTLHPNIHAGLLAKTELQEHVNELAQHNIKPIQLVAVNLYPFEDTISQPNVTLDTALEMIDIGGVAMLRAAAKNFKNVLVVIDPSDYQWVSDRIKSSGIQSFTLEERKSLAVKAFQHVVTYDSTISQYLAGINLNERADKVTTKVVTVPPTVVRTYKKQFDLKYGANPHQNPATILNIQGYNLPFKVLNGTPGYINLLDALNSWQLVKELREAIGLPAAASFKHVSPAGAAVAVPFTDQELEAYEIPSNQKLTPQAIAYLRARNADPLCSYGDFAAVSDVVDEATAMTLKTEVSDGIIAPGFDEKALEILKQKKSGNYLIIQADPNYVAPEMEYREVYGCVLAQLRNQYKLSDSNLKNVVTNDKTLSKEAIRDLLVATITIKYTQSNSVGYAFNGQMIGVGAGQQSRVDCTKLAGTKVANWHLRFHDKVRKLPFKQGTKRVERTNAKIHYIEDSVPSSEMELFEKAPEKFTDQEKESWMKQLKGVSCSSDAFFPFRDSVDVMAKYGVKFVAQPGGSIQDDSVVKACDEYSMVMAFTGVRLFHH